MSKWFRENEVHFSPLERPPPAIWDGVEGDVCSILKPNLEYEVGMFPMDISLGVYTEVVL